MAPMSLDSVVSMLATLMKNRVPTGPHKLARKTCIGAAIIAPSTMRSGVFHAAIRRLFRPARRLAKLENKLVGLATYRGIEDLGGKQNNNKTQNDKHSVEHEACGGHFFFHGLGVDA